MEKLKNLTINKLSFKSSFTWSIRLLICLFLFSSCERDEVKPSKEIETTTEGIEQENSMETMSFLEFSETDAYREVQERYYKPSLGNYEGRSGPCDQIFAVTGPVFRIHSRVRINDRRVAGVTYVIPISQIGDGTAGRPSGSGNAYFYNLIIVKTKSVTSNYLMAYEQGSNEPKGLFYLPPDGGTPISSGPCGGSMTIETSCCSGKHYGYSSDCCCGQQGCGENGEYENGSPGSSQTIYFPACDEGNLPCAFAGLWGYTSGSNTTYTGTGSGQGGSSSGGPNPSRIFLPAGQKAEYYPDGTATLPEHYTFFIAEPNINKEAVFELPGRSLISLLEIEQGTEAYQWLSDITKNSEHQQIQDFLNEHTENGVVEPEALEFVIEVIAILSSNLSDEEQINQIIIALDTTYPAITSNNIIDYENEILRMTTHLKNFGNIEDKIYAEYIESLVPDFPSMTIGEVEDIYLQVRETVHELRAKYFKAVVTPVVTDLVIPVVTYAVFEATVGTAVKLLQRIPVSMVLRGTRLNKMVQSVVQLGIQGEQAHVRIVTASSPVTRAEKLFASLTKDAISKTTNAEGTIVANMGSGNYITFRTVSGSGYPASINFNFQQLLGTNNFVIKFSAP